MVANIRGYTPNYNFKLINFDVPRWHTLEYANWTALDALMLQAGIPNFRGEWLHSTLYNEGDRVQDGEDGHLYRALEQHTSASSGTMAAERALHPDYWTIIVPGVPVYRGEWTPGVSYAQGDIVYIGYDYYLCSEQHNSSPAFATDVDNWNLVFSATDVMNDASTAADAAQSSAVDAATSATEAEAAKDAAEGFANDANSSATDAAISADSAASAQGAFTWNYDYNPGVSDPGVGKYKLNDPTPATTTILSLSAQTSDAGNPDVSNWVVTWDDSTNPGIKGSIYLRKQGDPSVFAVFNLTGTVSDLGTWLQVGVTYVAGSGTFNADDGAFIAFSRVGNQGLAGPGGGDMLAANYLSELNANKPLARTNIDLGNASTPTFAQVLIPSAPATGTHVVNRDYLDTRLTAALTIANTDYVNASGDTMFGDLTINKAAPYLTLDKTASGQHSAIRGSKAGAPRWVLALGNDSAESGGNTGSDCFLLNYDDFGGFLGIVFIINRANGLMSVKADPTTGLGVATKQYVDAAAALKVAKAGDTMSGDLNINNALLNITSGIGNYQIKMNGTGTGAAGYGFATLAGGNLSLDELGVASRIIVEKTTGKVRVLAGNPTATDGVATKAYVDAGDALKVAKAGDTMTGRLTIGPTADYKIDVMSSNGYHKYFFTDTAGSFLIYNHAASAPIITITDAGNLTIPGFINGGTGATLGGPFAVNGTTNLNSYVTMVGPYVKLQSTGDWAGYSIYNVAHGTAFGWYNITDTMYFGQSDGNGAATAVWRFNISPNSCQLYGAGGAWKPGGGPWDSTSDARIKNVFGEYKNGLASILTLNPVRYTYKGNDVPAGEPDLPLGADGKAQSDNTVPYKRSPHREAAELNKPFIGLIAQECENEFPEIILKRAGTIDGQPVTDIRGIDTGPLLFALINAVKELSAEVTMLKQQIGATR